MSVILNPWEHFWGYAVKTDVPGLDDFSEIVLQEASFTTPSSGTYDLVKTELKDESFHGIPLRPCVDQGDYGHATDMELFNSWSMDLLTPPDSFPMYADTPSESAFPSTGSFQKSFDPVDTCVTLKCDATDENLISELFVPRDSSTSGSLDLGQCRDSTGDPSYKPNSSISTMTRRRPAVHQKTVKPKRIRNALSKKSHSNSDPSQIDVARRAICKCDYPGCAKSFRRNEHLKRHKQTFHGEGPNRFSCEFCGKDQFNRQDNLRNHRKLHARPNSRNRGVEFLPAAVAIIEQEERSRKRRAPIKSKTDGAPKEATLA
ncbi:hypothetical protein FSARC_11524 [Fusarium sarcochroum]|uniref:C2H2-type domain-containing protein n=1 Tax=Fusarium sarcochroum TaxID=1208366 RepID=A0A8H4TEY4_9HYPO|nr:hypothetical protein FSARC_11524 [Fusarium sarcochroum]